MLLCGQLYAVAFIVDHFQIPQDPVRLCRLLNGPIRLRREALHFGVRTAEPIGDPVGARIVPRHADEERIQSGRSPQAHFVIVCPCEGVPMCASLERTFCFV